MCMCQPFRGNGFNSRHTHAKKRMVLEEICILHIAISIDGFFFKNYFHFVQNVKVKSIFIHTQTQNDDTDP